MDFRLVTKRLVTRHLAAGHLAAGFVSIIMLLQMSLSAQAADTVTAAEDWFAQLTTMQADFTQISSDGSAAVGTLYLRRPHRMKIEYEGDDALILITTPVWLHVDHPAQKRVTSYPISETALSLILKEKVILRADDFQTSAQVADGIATIYLSKESGEAAGDLALEFSLKPFQLRKWTVRDSVGVTTSVTLQNMKFGLKFRNELFRQSDYSN
ncbi:MAG: outer membrane lipoprotein carrier protein LolA [Candidatus Puniceispirillum sp.]|nr:outer membrane lipoprotein carrier protein LolA [Candidatus Puniceispirillum sp.]MBT6415879.1 outer membrane lipoprotein carrier protein LolA [Candidatus Puniceispirillum sp.]